MCTSWRIAFIGQLGTGKSHVSRQIRDETGADVVSFGGEVPAVPDAILQAIRRKVDEVNASGGEMPPTVSPGTTVNIEAGPFAGYQARCDSNLPGR